MQSEVSGAMGVRERRGLAPVLVRFWVWIGVMTAASVGFSCWMHFGFRLGYPFGFPVIRMDVFQWDFVVFQERFIHFRMASFWDAYNFPFTYPAPMALVFGLFYKLAHPLRTYLAGLLAAVLGWAYWLVRGLASRGVGRAIAAAFVGTVLVTSWPLLVLFQRANIEGVVIVVLTLGILAVLRDRNWLGATLIGLAGALKIFPLVLVGLLISKRRYKEAAWSFVVMGLVVVASLHLLGPSLLGAQQHVNEGLAFFKYRFACNPNPYDIGEEHSLFTLVKLVILSLKGAMAQVGPQVPEVPGARAALTSAIGVYTLTVAVLGVAAYFMRIRKLPMLNQVFALTVCAVLLPPISFDYTLPHLLLPFGLLCMYALETWRNGERVRGLRTCFVCLALVFTWGTYFVLRIRLSGQVRAVALVVLLVTVMRFPMWWRELDGLAESAGGTVVRGGDPLIAVRTR